MSFAAIFIPNFIVQAIVRFEPELLIRPLAIIAGQPPNFKVAAMNKLAHRLGVTAGMTKASAEQFANILFRQRSPAQEDAAHRALLDAAWSVSSLVEDTAPNTLLLDLTGLGRLFGELNQIAQRILDRTSEVGMDAHVAISANVETARVVAQALPGITVVPEGEERHHLDTLPVQMLSPTQTLADILDRWGMTTCKSLASLPVLSLSERLGQEGVRLHALAMGKGNRSLILAHPGVCFEERLELDDALDNLEPLSFLLGRVLQQLCARISARALSVGAIYVMFELQPAFERTFDSSDTDNIPTAASFVKSFSCSLKMPVPTQDHLLLLKLLRMRLQSKPPGAPVQKIHIIAEPVHGRSTQTGLFVPAAPDPQKLELTLARIAAVVGEDNVGSPELLDTHKPDGFHMQKFVIPSAIATAPASPRTLHSPSGNPTAFRVFRPPLPAWVQLQGNRPTRVAFQGMLGKVLRASGPWRSSGEWWDESPWQEDAWDLEIHFSSESPSVKGLYRVAYDLAMENWRVKGMYD